MPSERSGYQHDTEDIRPADVSHGDTRVSRRAANPQSEPLCTLLIQFTIEPECSQAVQAGQPVIGTSKAEARELIRPAVIHTGAAAGSPLTRAAAGDDCESQPRPGPSLLSLAWRTVFWRRGPRRRHPRSAPPQSHFDDPRRELSVETETGSGSGWQYDHRVKFKKGARRRAGSR